MEDSRPSRTLKIANEMMKGNKSLVLLLTDWLGIASMHINQNRFCLVLVSPPARGAWIEMGFSPSSERHWRSPPARGAWIEITC